MSNSPLPAPPTNRKSEVEPIRKSGWQWFFFLVLLPVAMGIGGWQGWLWWSWASSPVRLGNQPPTVAGKKPGPLVRIQIASGTSAQQIGRDLEAAGLIRSAQAWAIWSRWLKWQKQTGSFQAGTYELSPTLTMQEIAAKIWAGEVVKFSFTIPEGWSLQQMASYFEAQGFFTAEAFLQATRQPPYGLYPWLPPGLPHLEGFLYPDTYQLSQETVTPKEVVELMLQRFEQVALPLYQAHQQQLKSGQTKPGRLVMRLSLLEWTTLASIVEKEAVVPQERTLIAGVFAQRLLKQMPLGADPTVEYGLGIRQTPDQPLTFSQVRTPSPYNTYINVGLPPTPIASAGAASLEAALYPEDTPYLYFVARYDGTHVFSRTLAEHEAAQEAIHNQREQQNTQLSPAPKRN